MNGPEHYKRAEQIVDELEASAPHTPPEWHAARSAQAQVHATLAMAAAIVEASHNPERMQYPWLTAVGLVTE